MNRRRATAVASLVIFTLPFIFGEEEEGVPQSPPKHVAFPGEKLLIPWHVSVPSGLIFDRVAASCGCVIATGPAEGSLIPDSGLDIALTYRSFVLGPQKTIVKVWAQGKQEPVAGGVLSVDVLDAAKSIEDGSIWSDLILTHQTDGSLTARRRFVRGDNPHSWIALTLVKQASSSSTAFDAEITQIVSEKTVQEECWELVTRLNPQGICGTWANRIAFQFKDAMGSELPYTPTIRVLATIPGRVHASPPKVLIGALEGGSERTSQFSVIEDPGSNATLLSIDAEMDGREAPTFATVSVAHGAPEISENGRQWNAVIRVQARAGSHPGPAGGAVIALFSDGTRLRIPYIAGIAPKQ